MEERIPRQIAVGGFTVGIERVKKLVVAKYSEIIEGLGGAIALSTRKYESNTHTLARVFKPFVRVLTHTICKSNIHICVFTERLKTRIHAAKSHFLRT